MATGETGFDDVPFDLVSVHALRGGHDYGHRFLAQLSPISTGV